MKHALRGFFASSRLFAWLVVLGAMACCAPAAHATSVVGLWRFDEGSGTNTADSSGLNNNGTLQGTGTNLPTWVSSMPGFGDALYFKNDNTNFDYVSVPGSGSLQIGQTATNPWSITAWCYEMSNGSNDFEAIYGRILVIDGGVAFQLESGASGDDEFYTWDRDPSTNTQWQIGWGVDTSVSPLLDQWEHVAVVYDGTNINFYLNGDETNGGFASQQVTGALAYASYQGAITIGSELAQPANRNWNGYLDDVAIFNGALSQSQVQTVMAGNFTAFIGGPLSLLSQPQNQTVPAGTSASFTVGASGSGIQFQWYFNSTNKLAGQTNATLTIANAQAGDVGQYSAVVYNATTSIATQPARLLVYAPGTKMVALWRFNEGSGTTASDSTSLHNDGTLMGPQIGWGAGQPGFGSALAITNDEVDLSYVNVPGNESLMIGQTATNPWTITAWAYENSDGTGDFIADYGRILVIDDGTALQLESGASGDGEFYTWARANAGWQIGWGTGNDVSPLLDQWEHWAVVYDGTNISLYRDGNTGTNGGVASQALVQAIGYSGYQGSIHIGDELGAGASRVWNGLLDDIAVFAVPLTQSQIQTVMSGDFSAFLQQPQASLSIGVSGGNVSLSWPATFTNVQLQSKSDLGSATWTNVTATPVSNGGVLTVTVPVTAGNQFFRLAGN